MDNFYGFIVFATLVAVAPVPDMLLTIQSTVLGGKNRGFATILGIFAAALLQGVLVIGGLAALLVHCSLLFLTVRVLGIVYLLYMGASALRAAFRQSLTGLVSPVSQTPICGYYRHFWSSVRQGFLCNITNPKVILFNVSVLPQFVPSDASTLVLSSYCSTLVVIGTSVLSVVALSALTIRARLLQPHTMRAVNAATGTVMIAFAGALAWEQ